MTFEISASAVLALYDVLRDRCDDCWKGGTEPPPDELRALLTLVKAHIVRSLDATRAEAAFGREQAKIDALRDDEERDSFTATKDDCRKKGAPRR